jgi:acyl-CoA synthetase (AMP-forming)/AMP-acid ligase II
VTAVLEVVNIALRVAEVARQKPECKAIIVGAKSLTFKQLDALCDSYCHRLTALGIKRGTRTVLMVKPGFDFFALTFALFKIGAIPILVDPGMGRKNLGQCLKEAAPEAIIAIPVAHLARVLLGWGKPTVKILVTVGSKAFWGGQALLPAPEQGPFPVAQTTATDTAAILFTSGSTGAPKGVVYSHGVFEAEVRFLHDHFGFEEGAIDVPTFPLFALFDATLGITAVIPRMDFTRPGSVNPENILEPLRAHGATQMFGSPALLDRIGRYGARYGIQLPTLKHVISAGAPVPPAVLERFGRMLSPEALIHTPYGATEALPVCSINHHEILGETAALWATGEGTCVGKPIPGVTLEVIRISDEPIAEWSDDLRVTDGEIGEIVIKGPVVTQSYYNRPESNRLAKIQAADGTFYHRMGDLGKRDAHGRIWFQGRKAHRVLTEQGPLYTIPVEAIFNQHPQVARTALVGIGPKGAQHPVICVELEKGVPYGGSKDLKDDLMDLGRAHAHTRGLNVFLFHPSFPVDIRHNAKIFREKLATWAEGMLG